MDSKQEKPIQVNKILIRKTLVPRIKIKSFKKFNQLAQSVISKIEPSL